MARNGEDMLMGELRAAGALFCALPAKVQGMKMILALAGKPVQSQVLLLSAGFAKKNIPNAEILCRQGRTVTTGDFASFSL